MTAERFDWTTREEVWHVCQFLCMLFIVNVMGSQGGGGDEGGGWGVLITYIIKHSLSTWHLIGLSNANSGRLSHNAAQSELDLLGQG